MKGIDWLLLLTLLDGNDKESPPFNSIGGNPFRGLWIVFKIFVFLFLLIWFLFHQNLVSMQIKPQWKGMKQQHSNNIAPEAGESEFYIVRPGETLSEISEQTGCNQELLMSVNRLENPNRVYADQRLVLPKQNRAIPSRQ